MRGNLASYLLLLSESLSPWGSFLLLFFLPSPLVRSLWSNNISFAWKDLPSSNAAPTISLNKVLRMLTRLNCLCPTPSCSCPSGNCSHAHSWSGSGCCQAQAGAPLFAPAHSLLLNFRPIACQGHFSFFTGCKSSSSSSEPAAGPDNGRGRVF